MRILQLALVAIVWPLLSAAASHAGVLFFVNDEPGFAAAIAGSTLMGTENWSSAGGAPSALVSEPLQPGIANGVFPNGVDAATGITVQSNSHVWSCARCPGPDRNGMRPTRMPQFCLVESHRKSK